LLQKSFTVQCGVRAAALSVYSTVTGPLTTFTFLTHAFTPIEVNRQFLQVSERKGNNRNAICRRMGLLFSIALAFACPQHAANYVLPSKGRTVNVKDFGAKGDGMTDDTQAIQLAINSLSGGGIVRVPAGTYLLNSHKPSIHPWFFYNILVGSNVLIQSDPARSSSREPEAALPS
jgi:hypothetical protein